MRGLGQITQGIKLGEPGALKRHSFLTWMLGFIGLVALSVAVGHGVLSPEMGAIVAGQVVAACFGVDRLAAQRKPENAALRQQWTEVDIRWVRKLLEDNNRCLRLLLERTGNDKWYHQPPVE